MMKLTEIRQKGYKALIDSLGVVGMLRFLQELHAGSGDYTKEKYQLEEPKFEEFEEFIQQKNQLQDDSSEVNFSAPEALDKLDNTSEAVVQTLLTLLQDDNSSMRFSAVEVLGKLSNSSEPVVQALLTLLKYDDSTVRSSLVEVLEKLDNSSKPT
ncbi:HEAT repeat domain-containing protein [Okeania sp. SIO2B3]|uniref:HEAT repeat domain-containing protein n=1 Tax=Okeania sp. SIO2B3 TaxID=2607784 RepID=UPI0013C015C4|nr:HEAT repeat domain-containing protein [Okeania sp. SIO2B3]NET46083.1 HEAT repeat domain-containing protein [Okeania sp. SIO2B3]